MQQNQWEPSNSLQLFCNLCMPSTDMSSCSLCPANGMLANAREAVVWRTFENMTLSDASGRFLPEPFSPPTSVALAGSLFLREISFSQELCICTGELCRSKTKLALVSTCCSESLDSEKEACTQERCQHISKCTGIKHGFWRRDLWANKYTHEAVRVISGLNDAKESRMECRFPIFWHKTRTRPTWNNMPQFLMSYFLKKTIKNLYSWGALPGAGRTSPVLLFFLSVPWCQIGSLSLAPCRLSSSCVVMRLSEGQWLRWFWDSRISTPVWRWTKTTRTPGTKTVVQYHYIYI